MRTLLLSAALIAGCLVSCDSKKDDTPSTPPTAPTTPKPTPTAAAPAPTAQFALISGLSN